MRQRPAALALSLMLVMLAGCSGEQPSLPAIGAAATSSDSQSASAFDNAPAADNAGGLPQFGSVPNPEDGARKIIENPTVADVMQPGPLPEMALGKANAPVTIVQYASLTCPHCRAFHEQVFPEFKRTYIDTGKVRFILREFPIGKQSGTATIALRCAKPEKYFDLYGKFMKQQASWVSQEVRLDPIFAIAKQVGMTRAEFDACQQNQGMIEALKQIKERGRSLGIIGTPNYFVQGKLVKSTLAMADLRALIDPLLTATPSTVAQSPAR